MPARAHSIKPQRQSRREGIADPARIQDLFLARLDELERRVAAELTRPLPMQSPLQALASDVGREGLRLAAYALGHLLRPDQLAAVAALALAARPVDQLGLDDELRNMARDLLIPAARLWLGLDDVPERTLPPGGVLITFNRSAWPLPAEPLLLWAVLVSRFETTRSVCALWEPGMIELPFLGGLLGRLGIFAASQANARILLERGAVVIAFPEGQAAHAKTYDRRYRLARFEDDCLIRAAIECGAAIVPGAVVGSEESFPVLAELNGWPLTPTFPLAGLLGLLPLPLRWRVRLGAALEYPVDASPATHASGVADALRARTQAMLGEMLAARRSDRGDG